MTLPSFELLAANYLDYWNYPNPQGVKRVVGGDANDADITNTCTIRVSHAMNASGAAIPQIWGSSKGKPIFNRRGHNGRYYIIRVSNFRTWMEHRFGKPDLDFTKQPGGSFDRATITGYQGVIAFDIGFSDATGHFDLWYRDKFSHESSAGKDYFALAQRISLWTDGTRWVEAPV